jgi:hypothetical protein
MRPVKIAALILLTALAVLKLDSFVEGYYGYPTETALGVVTK